MFFSAFNCLKNESQFTHDWSVIYFSALPQGCICVILEHRGHRQNCRQAILLAVSEEFRKLARAPSKPDETASLRVFIAPGNRPMIRVDINRSPIIIIKC